MVGKQINFDILYYTVFIAKSKAELDKKKKIKYILVCFRYVYDKKIV